MECSHSQVNNLITHNPVPSDDNGDDDDNGDNDDNGDDDDDNGSNNNSHPTETFFCFGETFSVVDEEKPVIFDFAVAI